MRSHVNQLRILVLAPDANPESISVSLVCYLHAEALARLHRVTLVGRSWHEGPLRRAQAQASFHAVETIKVPWLDNIYTWSLRRIFRYNFRSNLLTPSAILFQLLLNGLHGGAYGLESKRGNSTSYCVSRRSSLSYLALFLFFCGTPQFLLSLGRSMVVCLGPGVSVRQITKRVGSTNSEAFTAIFRLPNPPFVERRLS